jgi:hypothetical protein
MISKEHQIVIIAYLAAHAGLQENWFVEPQKAFFGLSPQNMVNNDEGDAVIDFLEIRLGLQPGAAF